MTKMEVRTVSVAKLELTEHSVLYDVGAGTGSVSVECAGLSDSVKVYAIEKNPEAVELLYENRKKFALTNVKIIAGTAPEALEDLPAPTMSSSEEAAERWRRSLRYALRKILKHGLL